MHNEIEEIVIDTEESIDSITWKDGRRIVELFSLILNNCQNCTAPAESAQGRERKIARNWGLSYYSLLKLLHAEKHFTNNTIRNKTTCNS